MESNNKKMIGAGAVVLFLMTGAWMMGKKSSAPASPALAGFAQQQPGMMNPGAAPQGAMPPQGAQYGANPGAELPQQQGGPTPQINGGQMGPPQNPPSNDMSPGAGPLGAGGDPSQQYQPPMNGGGAGGGQQYQDPNGQFTIRVPSGWQSTPQNGGVVITRGGSMVMVSPFDGAQSGEQIVSTIARQYGSQWQGLQVSDQGRFQINGAPAAYMMMNGRSPRGVQSLLRVAGTVRGSQGFAIIISSPFTEFNSASPELQSIESSLSFGGGE